MMIFVHMIDENRTVQAMRVPELADIAKRTDMDFWLCSLKGRRQFKFTGRDITFAATRWRVGEWIVAEVDPDTGNTVFSNYDDFSFTEKFSRVA